MSNEFLSLGYVSKAHGIRGEISIEYLADSPRLLRPTIFLRSFPGVLKGGGRFAISTIDLARLSATEKSAIKEYKVSSVRMHQERPLLILEGVADRDAAEILRGQHVLIPYDRLPRLGKNEAYLFQLPGLEVYYKPSGSDSEELLGIIESVDTGSGREVWAIKTPAGKEVLFPAASDFVREIDLDTKTARISPPEGLIELYL